MANKVLQRRAIAGQVSLEARLEALEQSIALLLIDARSRVQSPAFEVVAQRMKRALGQEEEPLVGRNQQEVDDLVRRRASKLEQDGKPVEALLLLRRHGL